MVSMAGKWTIETRYVLIVSYHISITAIVQLQQKALKAMKEGPTSPVPIS
jgi:hypothetical protein